MHANSVHLTQLMKNFVGVPIVPHLFERKLCTVAVGFGNSQNKCTLQLQLTLFIRPMWRAWVKTKSSKTSCFGQQAAVVSERPKQPHINAAEAAAHQRSRSSRTSTQPEQHCSLLRLSVLWARRVFATFSARHGFAIGSRLVFGTYATQHHMDGLDCLCFLSISTLVSSRSFNFSFRPTTCGPVPAAAPICLWQDCLRRVAAGRCSGCQAGYGFF